jgi:hypothetical protein
MPLNWNFPAEIGPKTGRQVTGVTETNGTMAAAKVSAAIPGRTFEGMSAYVSRQRKGSTAPTRDPLGMGPETPWGLHLGLIDAAENSPEANGLTRRLPR